MELSRCPCPKTNKNQQIKELVRRDKDIYKLQKNKVCLFVFARYYILLCYLFVTLKSYQEIYARLICLYTQSNGLIAVPEIIALVPNGHLSDS